jgi:UDP-glucose 4-epimerase
VRVLVTGGAGFIGSNLVDALVAAGDEVRILDDLSNGLAANANVAAELVEGSVADPGTVARAVDGCELVFHLAALGSVSRSVENPLATDTANVHGTLAVLKGALDAGARRVVFSSSSSVYGGATPPPTPESAPLAPKSPYAVSKLAGEQYCRVFAQLFDIETVALRFFNVFGPRQRPDSQYAAVIPLFATALREGRRPTVHGDGMQSRDFTYVGDVVAALRAAGSAPGDACNGNVYNVAGGRNYTLLDLLDALGTIIGTNADPEFVDPRPGDIKFSKADPSAAARDLGWKTEVEFDTGLRHYVDWLQSRQ